MISIDADACIACQECREVCPNYVFAANGEGKAVGVRYPEHCFSCGHCIAVCPTQAVSHPDLPLDKFEPLTPPAITAEAMETLLRSRRSIRNYKPEPVPRPMVEALLTAAAEAGSSSNGQTEGFIVIEDQARLRRLEAIVIEVLWKKFFRYAGATGFVRRVLRRMYGTEALQEADRYRKLIEHRRADGALEGMVFRNAPLVLIAHGLERNRLAVQNCALALRNVELLALTMGLGTCWVGFLVAAAKAARIIPKLVGLPPGRQIYGALMVGFPNEQYAVKVPRKPRPVAWFTD